MQTEFLLLRCGDRDADGSLGSQRWRNANLVFADETIPKIKVMNDIISPIPRLKKTDVIASTKVMLTPPFIDSLNIHGVRSFLPASTDKPYGPPTVSSLELEIRGVLEIGIPTGSVFQALSSNN
jgi:hypothetical protein